MSALTRRGRLVLSRLGIASLALLLAVFSLVDPLCAWSLLGGVDRQDGPDWRRRNPHQPTEGLTVTDMTDPVSADPVSANPLSADPLTQDTATLEATHLSRSFDARLAVDDVSFQVTPGETYGLLGPNGAGKTTTIRLVCGLLSADAGEVTVAGMPVSTSTTRAKAQIGYVPQDVSLYPDLTARENLAFFGRLYRLRGKALRERAAEVLDLIDLTDRGDDRVETFSGGMKRRLNIGASLLHRPSLLVLDEPTVGVDPQSRHAIMESIRSLGSEGVAVLYTTHYMEEAERLCDRVGIIDHGRLIAEGTRRELVAKVGGRDRITLSAEGSLAAFAQACGSLEGIEQVDVADSTVHLLAVDGRRRLAQVMETATRTGTAVRSVEVDEPDLEAVFLHLTGTALRE